MVVPTCRLHFDVLPNHIETQVLGFLDVVGQCLVGRCGVEAIRPPALVERTEMEDGKAIERETHDTAFVALRAEASHGKIAVHLIDHFTLTQHLDFHVIQERMVGRPAQEFLRHVHLDRLPVDGLSRRYGLAFK